MASEWNTDDVNGWEIGLHPDNIVFTGTTGLKDCVPITMF